MSSISIPTSQTGFLPHVMGALDTQIGEINKAEETGPTLQQRAVAILTASVFTAVIAVVDSVIHAACYVAYAVPVAIKASIGRITGFDQYMPKALDVDDWFGHVREIHSCVVMLLNSVSNGWADPEGVLLVGRRLGLLRPLILNEISENRDQPLTGNGGKLVDDVGAVKT